MTTAASHPTRNDPLRPMQGVPAWIITGGMAGMVAPARAIAERLGLDYAIKPVSLSGLAKVSAPWGRPPRREAFGSAGTAFAPPWPAVAIATGRAGVFYLRALKRLAGVQVFTVILQDPRMGPAAADFIWAPEHDRIRGPNVLTTLTGPHAFSAARLTDLRQTVPAEIAALPQPRLAVLLGGKSGAYRFTAEDDARLARALADLGRLGASFMITTSRRTHENLKGLVEAATRSAPRLLYDGEGPNPYADFLAHADGFVVTADSVNMTGECCAAGRPVYVFTPSGGKAKFAQFHAALCDTGITRPLPDPVDRLPAWRPHPIDSTDRIAAEIARRWQRRCKVLHGDPEPGV